MKRYFIAVLILSGLFFSSVQGQPFKFGKISKKDLDPEYYQQKYPDDYAVTIGDMANCKFIYNNSRQRFQFYYERSCRIMVLDERGIELGDIIIPYYRSKNSVEEISRFKVNVYNLENGKLKKEKFNKRNVFTEDIGNNWNLMKYPATNVRPGSVIEYTYVLSSDFMSQLRGWEFQKDYPVEYTSYELRLPAIFKYRKLFRGFTPVEETVDHEQVEHFRIHSKREGPYGAEISGGEFTASTPASLYTWKAEEVPAFIHEPFTDNYRNYLTSIDFEYIGEQWPDMPPNNVSETWEDVSKKLYEDEDFGEYLKQAYLEVFEKVPLDIKGLELIPSLNMALKAIRERVRFNNEESIWADTSPDKVLKMGVGNSAEINLLLIALLQNNGIDAQPVLLSTRRNGRILSENPTMVQFNYMLVAVEDPEKGNILLDATQYGLPARYIPNKAVNGKGRLISKTDSKWIPLENPGRYHQRRTYDLTLNDDGSLSGDFCFSYFDYGGIVEKQNVELLGTDYLTEKIKETIKAKIENVVVEIPDSASAIDHLEATGSMLIEDFSMPTGNEIFLQPLLMETFTRHQFQLQERQYPISFTEKSLTEIEITLKLPEKLTVNELPEKHIIRFGNSLIYEYDAFLEGELLKITGKLLQGVQQINADYYPHVKGFFNSMIEKNRENIVLTF